MNTLEVSACFPVAHLAFAAAWAAAAPGGWGLAVDPTDEGETVSVWPPGSEDALFILGIEHGAVETQRVRSETRGGGLVGHGSHATLPQAVLALCPLPWRQLRNVLKATRKACGEGR